MRGWRRNLAFCLQRLPDEGRTRPPPRPVSTGAARGEEGGPSAGLIGGRPLGAPRGRRGADGGLLPRRGRGAPEAPSPKGHRRTCGLERSWAGGGGHSGRLRGACGGGTGARATA